EFYDAVEAALDLLAAQSQDGAVQVDVIPAGQIRMKAGAELDQGRHPSLDSNMTAGRLGHPGEDLQQRGLAGAIVAYDADDLAGAHGEGHILKRPEVLVRVRLVGSPRGQTPAPAGHKIAQAAVAGAKAIPLGYAIELDDRGGAAPSTVHYHVHVRRAR